MHFKPYILAILCILLIGCKPVERIVEVPVPQIKTEYIQNDIVYYDSIYIENEKIIEKDTVYQKYIEYRYKILYKDSIQIKTDTITIVKEIEIEQPVPYVPQWVKILATIGALAIAALLFMILKK